MENENVSTENVNTKKENEDQKLGKIIKVGNFAYTVDGFEFRKSIGDQYYSKTADGVYLLIAISITNNGNETKTIDNSLFNLTGVNGSKYEYSTDGSVALEMAGAKTLFLKQCQPGITTQGILIFEVPEQDSYYLHLTGGYLSNKSKKVLLK